MEGYNCSQSVFFAFCDDLKMDKDLALKIACGFGQGMGAKEEVCGAVTGGIMALGLKFGRGLKDEPAATELTYKKTRELMDKFSAQYGTFSCLKLLDNCDLKTDEGKKFFKENDLRNKICKPCVQSTIEMLEGVL